MFDIAKNSKNITLAGSIGEYISFYMLLTILIFLPILKAGMMDGADSLLMASVSVILLMVFFFDGREYQKVRLWLLVWCVVSLCIFLHVFLVPNLFGGARFFSDGIDGHFLKGGGGLSTGLEGFQSLVLFTCMWVIAWRVSVLEKRQIAVLLIAIIMVSFFQIVYGLWHFLSGANTILGLWEKQYMLLDVTGTFVNRNHFSGMLAMCWPIVLSGLLSDFRMFGGMLLIRRSVVTIYSILMVAALVASHSRMGLTAAIFGLFVWVVVFTRAGNSSRGVDRQRWGPWCAIFFLMVFAVWFGLEDILLRYTQMEGGNGRAEVWSAMFDLPALSWVVGIGPGMFGDVFALVQPSHLNVRFGYAHNDYLEFILEFGIVFSALIFLAVLYWAKKVYPRGGLGLRAGAIGAIAAVSLHSTVDFNLQIPGSAIFFWVAVGLLMNPNMVDASAGDSIDELLGSDSDDMLSDDESQSDNKPRKRKRKKVSKVPKNRRAWIAFFRSK